MSTTPWGRTRRCSTPATPRPASGTLTLASAAADNVGVGDRGPSWPQPLLHHRPQLLDGVHDPELGGQRGHPGSHQHHVRLDGDHDLPGLHQPHHRCEQLRQRGPPEHVRPLLRQLPAQPGLLRRWGHVHGRHPGGRHLLLHDRPDELRPGVHARVEQRGGCLPAASRGLRHRLPAQWLELRHHPDRRQLRPHRGPDHPGRRLEQQRPVGRHLVGSQRDERHPHLPQHHQGQRDGRRRPQWLTASPSGCPPPT